MTTSRTAGLRARVPRGLLGFVDETSSRVASTGQTLGLRAGFAAVRALPSPAAYRLFDLIADVSARRGGKGVDRLRSNYARVRPELGERELAALVRAGMRSYMRYYCNAFRLADRSQDELAAAVRMVGDEPIREALASGSGCVLFMGHLGDWDTGGAWSSEHLAPVTTVAERLEPEEVFRDFLEFRESLGMTIIPLDRRRRPVHRPEAGRRRGCVRGAARRPRPHPQRRRGRSLRAPGPDGQGTGGPRRDDQGAAVRGDRCGSRTLRRCRPASGSSSG